MWSNINANLASQAPAQQAQIRSQEQVQTISIQMQADARKARLDRHKILHDTQTKVFDMQRNAQGSRAPSFERANQILQYIR